MKISINIQSYKRAGDVKTLRLFPNANLWVHEFELEEYKKAYPDTKILALSDDFRGNLPKVKNHILDVTKMVNDVTVILDDDISYFGYWEAKKMVKMEDEEILMKFIEKYTKLAKEWGAKLWGINVNPDKQVYREYSPFSTLSYISSSFSCFLKDNECRYDPRLPLKEDYDMLLQQCLKYRMVLRVNKFFYSKKSAENTGGCATYRNMDQEKSQLEELQKKWGSIIVKAERLDSSRSHSSEKKRAYDINPIVHVPIKGI